MHRGDAVSLHVSFEKFEHSFLREDIVAIRGINI